MRSIPQDKILAFIRDIGFDPDNVKEIHLTPRRISITHYLLNEDGKKYVDIREVPATQVTEHELVA